MSDPHHPIATREADPHADHLEGGDTRPAALGRSISIRLLRTGGWLLIAAGLLVVLYLAYSLLFTNTITNAAQEQMLEEWTMRIDAGEAGDVGDDGASSASMPHRPPSDEARTPEPAPEQIPLSVPEGDAVALMTFRRPGEQEPLLHDRPLAIVEGVTREVLKRGPGRYPGTAMPGEDGNFAVAGHRTTYGAPFFHLDRLRAGDLIEAVDSSGATWTYTVTADRVVGPEELWTIGPDPLGGGRPMLTLTTCYPRFSDAERLIVFAELTGP